MNLPIAGHPERTGVSGTSTAESKDGGDLSERSSESAGSFDSILVAQDDPRFGGRFIGRRVEGRRRTKREPKDDLKTGPVPSRKVASGESGAGTARTPKRCALNRKNRAAPQVFRDFSRPKPSACWVRQGWRAVRRLKSRNTSRGHRARGRPAVTPDCERCALSRCAHRSAAGGSPRTVQRFGGRAITMAARQEFHGTEGSD